MRKAFLVINALLTLSLIAQLYLAALGFFSEPEDELFRFHGMNGRFILPVLLILWIIFGFIAKIGRRNIILTFVGLLLLVLQTGYFIIAGAMGASPPPNATTPGATPYILALHGLGGTLLLLLTVWVFFSVRAMGPLARSRRDPDAVAADSTSASASNV
ncbi:MAG: DUF6220 domain-containing protein [Microbacterium sp.]